MTSDREFHPSPGTKPVILHVCRREILRPLRDQILRLSGFEVDSTAEASAGLAMLWSRAYDLVLIDVDGEAGVPEAELFCSEIKDAMHTQKIAFVCNWRISDLTDCPDEILRTEFDPDAFARGVHRLVSVV